MKIDLKFIPQNTALKGTKNIGLYDSDGNKLKNILLGNLAPKSKGNKLYTFGAISDVHLPYSTGTDDFVRALNYLNNEEKVDFICISGDMGSAGTDDEWASYKNYVDTYSPNTPVHISAGNHDAGTSSPKTYEYPIQYTGNPLYYSFTQGNDVFIMFGMTFGGTPPFSNESLQWLYETLEENRNKRCFVFQHMMRKNHAGDASGRYPWDGLNGTNGKVFLSLMEHYKNVLWFHGHSHCEFEQQATLALPNSNYDRAFGCHSIHVPSCCMTRNEDNGYDYEDSEGYVVDVYKNGIHLRGRDFVGEKFLPIASYWIDTTVEEIEEKTYVDNYGVIKTGNESEGPSINIVSTLLDTDLTNVYNGIGYKTNVRVGSTGEVTDIDAGFKTTLTGLIPLEKDGDVLHIRGVDRVTYIDGRHVGWCSLWDSTGAFLVASILFPEAFVSTDENGDFAMAIDYATLKVNEYPTASYIRLQLGEVADELIITRNQLINTDSNTPTDNIIIFDKSEFNLNARYSYSGGTVKELGGVISINPSVEPNAAYKLTYSGAKTDISVGYDTLCLVSSEGVVFTVNGDANLSKMTEGVVYNEDYTGVEVTFTTNTDTAKIWFSILVNPAGTYIMSVDELTDVVLTLEKL